MTSELRGKICVFTGSSPGAHAEYMGAARDFGRALVAHGYGLVYGGARVGLMAAVADAVLNRGGYAAGVIPDFLVDREIAHPRLSDLRVVSSMHERKALMVDMSDGFVALPGGLGTLDEFFEALTWAQRGLHAKPCGLLNVRDYFRRLLGFLDDAVDARFIKPAYRAMIVVEQRPHVLLEKFARYSAPENGEWLDRGMT
ncbi:MAG: TIGR00730 family Rossman fold protein [Gammaproteobacteria bacterium]